MPQSEDVGSVQISQKCIQAARTRNSHHRLLIGGLMATGDYFRAASQLMRNLRAE
jgi:hypothetical protein